MHPTYMRRFCHSGALACVSINRNVALAKRPAHVLALLLTLYFKRNNNK